MGKRITSVLLVAMMLLCWMPNGLSAQAADNPNLTPVPEGYIDYTSGYTGIRQFACEEAGGVYFLRGDQLHFLNLDTGESQLAYTFPSSSKYFYRTQNLLYWAADGIIEVFDLEAGEVLRTLTVDDYNYTGGIGVDSQGRIYLSVCDDQSTWFLNLYTADGILLDQMETEGQVYEFAGFTELGELYFVAYHNWVYWGYDHAMYTLLGAKVSGDEFCDVSEGYQQFLVGNLCQMYYYQYQDNAVVFDQSILADKNGNVYDVSNGSDQLSHLLVIPREYDEELPNVTFDTNSIGVRMLYNKEKNTLIAYTNSKMIWEYDLATGEQLRCYQTQHYVFSLLEYGSSIIAIEKEGENYFLELFDDSDLVSPEKATINLNETDTYRSHTEAAVQERWEDAYIPSGTKVYASEYSLDPYTPAVYTDEMKEGLVDFSNYLRWLGGLTPFTSADDETWDNAAKGAVVLTETGELTHSPSQPEDMDNAFFEAAYDGCSNSNLSGGGIYTPEAAMSHMVGWLNDTANATSLANGHRFTFLQRAGHQIAYGSTGSFTAQTVQAYNSQENATGTIIGVDNNDYCYTWPGAGYFPTNAINTRAQWSINLNSDLIDLSNAPLTVTIEDLDTGEVMDRSDSLGSSAYYGINTYFGYFYGECFYFDPPQADSYEGKNYQVTIGNLQLSNGQPAEITYSVHFCTLNHSWDEGTVTKTPTTSAEGEISYTCTECGTVITEYLPRICDHPTTVLSNTVTPTCTADGYSGDRVCVSCGAVVEQGAPISATGHSFGAWTQTKAPTTQEEGLRERVCSCGEKETQTVEKLTPPSPDPTPTVPAVEFTDVKEDQWFYNTVQWAVQNGITNGMTPTTFGPNETCTRKQVVTFLWRAQGSPEPNSTNNPFADVKESDYFYKAVLWAVENGITKGIDATHFDPNGKCTRGQVVTFLHRAAGTPAPGSTENPFSDVGQQDYYTDAVLWAVSEKITEGMTKTTFAPGSTCTRAQIVTFLYRALS